MRQTSSVSADAPSRSGARRGIVTGVVAGIVALGCCVGPTVAALVGITSATVAIDIATNLYATWGWAFKLAGVAFGMAAVVISARQRRACGAQPRILRSLLVVALAGGITFALLIRRGRRDAAWLVGGVLVLWFAFAGFRTLH